MLCLVCHRSRIFVTKSSCEECARSKVSTSEQRRFRRGEQTNKTAAGAPPAQYCAHVHMLLCENQPRLCAQETTMGMTQVKAMIQHNHHDTTTTAAWGAPLEPSALPSASPVCARRTRHWRR